MINGIYSVKFKSLTGEGTGTVVFIDGRSYGGDFAYYYKGPFQLEGDKLSGKIEVVRHQPGESIFGPLDRFHLKLSGTQAAGSFNLQGNVLEHPDQTIRINGKKISEL